MLSLKRHDRDHDQEFDEVKRFREGKGSGTIGQAMHNSTL
jgi:hypothetical protein